TKTVLVEENELHNLSLPATAWAEGAQLNGRPFPATASAEGAQLNGRPFPATASAEGAQLNGRPFPATASAEGAQLNGCPFPATASAEGALPLGIDSHGPDTLWPVHHSSRLSHPWQLLGLVRSPGSHAKKIFTRPMTWRMLF